MLWEKQVYSSNLRCLLGHGADSCQESDAADGHWFASSRVNIPARDPFAAVLEPLALSSGQAAEITRPLSTPIETSAYRCQAISHVLVGRVTSITIPKVMQLYL